MIKHWTIIALALLLLQGCTWNEDISKLQTPEWEAEIAAPIAKGTISIGQALDQVEDFSYLEIEPDGTLVFKANFPLASWALPELVEMPDFAFPIPESGIIAPFPVEGVERMTLSSGQVDYTIVNTSAQSLRLVLSVTGLSDSQGDFTQSINFEGAGTFQGTFDLTGYSFVPIQGGIGIDYTVFEQGSGTAATVDQVGVAFSGMDPSYIEGRLPETDISLDIDTLDIKADLGVDFSAFTLADPELNFIIESQVGVENTFSFPTFSVMSGEGVGKDLIYEPFNMGSSLTPASTPGEWARSAFEMNRGNSNLGDLLTNGVPGSIVYEASITAFPEGSTEVGFITNEDSIRVTVEAEAPLAFQLGDTEFTQDIDLDVEMIDLIKNGTLLLTTENGIPLELDLQMYLMDGKDVVMDSVFTNEQPILAGALVDAEGYTTTEGEARVEIPFTESLLNNIDNATGLRLRATVSSTQDGSQTVRLTEDQSLSFRLGIKTN